MVTYITLIKLTLIIAPWCGHCQKLVPDYEKLSKAVDGIINIGAVDMTTDQVILPIFTGFLIY